MRAQQQLNRFVAALGLLAVSACGPRTLPPTGEVLLYIDTDAPLPPPAGQLPAPEDPPPLFDALQVDVFEPGATTPCDGCSRVFPLDAARLRDGRASFGIPEKPHVSGYRVRLRLFYTGATLTGQVPTLDADGLTPSSVIDVTAALPPVADEGIVETHVFLATDSVGTPIGSLDAPVAIESGPPGSSRVGSWPGSRRVPCANAPRSEEVCVPGGAYWMGNARVRGNGIGDGADRLRLVVMSPYFMDSTEVTVGAFRSFGEPDTIWDNGTDGLAWEDFCTFTKAPNGRDELPVNCLERSTARAYCNARGADLPTEAQFEYAASGLEGRLYVWGSDEPSCEDAVLTHAGYGLFVLVKGCDATMPPGGALPVGSTVSPPRRDRLELATGTLYDLVGNVSEWVLDSWNRQTEPCWSHGGVYTDPLCTYRSPADRAQFSYRGGSWLVTPRQAAAATRNHIVTVSTGQGVDLGFRCARPDAP